MEGWRSEVRLRTWRITSPGVFSRSGKRWLSERPTIMAMILSISSPSSGWVAIHWPSRRMVISSHNWKISSILCEI
ncbi:Uncharacterised protein [Klebsiella pneumoniae]|nr:Uncharacterised protein [Klebsiella pneumoniae]SXL74362.1 Uncharacterised protein [Klebsiella pneumoniae]